MSHVVLGVLLLTLVLRLLSPWRGTGNSEPGLVETWGIEYLGESVSSCSWEPPDTGTVQGIPEYASGPGLHYCTSCLPWTKETKYSGSTASTIANTPGTKCNDIIFKALMAWPDIDTNIDEPSLEKVTSSIKRIKDGVLQDLTVFLHSSRNLQ